MNIIHSPRIFTNQDLTDGKVIDLTGPAAFYLGKVLRKRKGDMVRIFNGRDGEFSAQITLAKRFLVSVDVKDCLRQQASSPQIQIYFALIKKQRLETLLEKATELGATSFHPIITQRTNAKMPKQERLEAIIQEAAEQSERLDIPSLHTPVNLQTCLENWSNDAIIYACLESGEGEPLTAHLTGDPITPAAIFIGPEGGFNEAETSYFETLPFVKSTSLGPRILKSDTAVMMALSLWQAHHGDGNLSPPRND